MNYDPIEAEIDRDARLFLLSLARSTIQRRLDGQALPSTEPEARVLLEQRGAFVTLKIDGRLRGCIGHVIGVAPLWLAVRDNAIAAAFEDPRFEASVTSEEISFGYVKLRVRAFVKEKLDYGPDQARLMTRSVAALKRKGIALRNV